MTKSIRNSIVSAIGLALTFVGVMPAHAQIGGAFFKNEAGTGIGATTKAGIGEAVITIINYVLGFLGLVAVVLIIYGGILMVTSAGNEEGVTKAKKIITWSAVGIVLIILSYSIVQFITNVIS